MKSDPRTHVPLQGYVERAPHEQLGRAEALHRHLSTRRSVRDFAPTPVDRAVIEACVAAAGTAPSGANHQPWFFACVGSPEKKREIRLAAEAEERAFYSGKAGEEWLDALAPIGTDAQKPYMETAPWLICIFAQRRGGAEVGDNRKNYYIHESVGIATGLLIAACHEAGLATLVHTPNPMSFLNRLCDRPDTEKPYLILAVGHPAEGAKVPKHALKKKALGDICSFS
ncbi:nitroreductase family protein [Henriciella barbarensis]|uniref:Nitroreductase family protein n=1 Tax=Henriciella barbarensis TaxID=86342 RepID=A0A399R5L6_9PROT|nr:nitroreductase family protein [Henriciella barbarensis]RIJ24729.1 nitroreductase family protein [Henriciella barbarensis]